MQRITVIDRLVLLGFEIITWVSFKADSRSNSKLPVLLTCAFSPVGPQPEVETVRGFAPFSRIIL